MALLLTNVSGFALQLLLDNSVHCKAKAGGAKAGGDVIFLLIQLPLCIVTVIGKIWRIKQALESGQRGVAVHNK